jgi:glycosyltransferase involved in cell wall biosynthesis
MFIRPSASTVQQIKAHKEQRRRLNVPYVEAPSCSVIVQSFNQARNVSVLESRLRATSMQELIVCEDGSLDGSHEAWLQLLVNPNDFLLHSNDLHEIRTYNRAIGFARGAVVCLMQDDDRPPVDGAWLAQALDVFRRYPRLAVLGGWCGFDRYFEVEYNAPWLPSGENPIPSLDPATGRPLTFVENVNIGPYFLRKCVFDELGGFDLRFSGVGEPGITFESEFCYRAWRAGHQVALTDIPVKQQAGDGSYILPGGTSMWGNEARMRNERANKQLIRSQYDHDLPEIQRAVREANKALIVA